MTGTPPGRAAPGIATLLGVLALALLLEGCGIQSQRPVAGREPVLPTPILLPDIDKRPLPAPAVAVVLSSDSSHYRSVADALGDGRWKRYVLGGSRADMLAELASGGHVEAIAIGQQALSLLADTGLKVAYCQVFDPVAGLSSEVRGVAPLPDFGPQLDAWLLRQPALKRLGLITGPDYPDVAQRLELAAVERAIAVHHVVARSDRELLYVFRRMVPEIHGFLLYPDTSILSPKAIRELLDYARKHDVRVLTYNRAVFDLGADLLVSADPAEVASQVRAALEPDVAGGVEAALRQVVIESKGAVTGGAQ